MRFSEAFLRVLSEIFSRVFFFIGSSSVHNEILSKFSQEFFRSIIFRSIKQEYSREVVHRISGIFPIACAVISSRVLFEKISMSVLFKSFFRFFLFNTTG